MMEMPLKKGIPIQPVANFNIANLNKSAEEFLPDKKARPDLSL